MESAGGKIKIKIQYSIWAIVKRIEWRNQPDGWFVQFEGSWESLNFGIEHPAWDVGDTVKITFQHQEPECPPSPNTNPSDSQNSSCLETPSPGRPEAS